MVGGFTFYDRAEIKDMLSYLKLVKNPHDSIALQRVINTPARGIGKTTMETVERLALETGMSLWGSLDSAVQQKLLPQRACVALVGFKELVEDARAMLTGEFVDRVAQTTRETPTTETRRRGDTQNRFTAEISPTSQNRACWGPQPRRRGVKKRNKTFLSILLNLERTSALISG